LCYYLFRGSVPITGVLVESITFAGVWRDKGVTLRVVCIANPSVVHAKRAACRMLAVVGIV
jgi:hypothetical protein